MQQTAIIDVIQKTAPLALAAPWDNSGVQVAGEKAEVTRLALTLDPTPAAIAAALEWGAQCIVSHHPLLLKPRLPNKLDGYHAVLRSLFAAGATLYAAHTSLDCNPCGPVGWLGQELDLANTRVLEATGTLPEGLEGAGSPCGFGLVGDMPREVTLEQLLVLLQHHIALDTAALCGPTPGSIRRVAYCTGAGASLCGLAAEAGADVFITGDVKHHAALDATIPTLDVGHHSLEEEMMRRFAQQLARELAQVEVRFVASTAPLKPVPLAHQERK